MLTYRRCVDYTGGGTEFNLQCLPLDGIIVTSLEHKTTFSSLCYAPTVIVAYKGHCVLQSIQIRSAPSIFDQSKPTQKYK